MKVIRKQYHDDGRAPTTDYDGPEIIDYDTSHLDDIDGHVSDYAIVPAATHSNEHAAITRPSRGGLVIPTPTQGAGNQFPTAIGEMMTVGNQFAGQLMAADPYGRSTQNDNAVTIAKASLMYSSAHIGAIAFITFALLMLAYPLVGGRLTVYLFVGLLVWGAAGLGALLWNRAQGLHHSATGIAHADISARERVAIHAIDKNHETFANVLDRVYGGKK